MDDVDACADPVGPGRSITAARADRGGADGGLEVFLRMLHLVRRIARERKVDPSRPAGRRLRPDAEKELKMSFRGGTGLYPRLSVARAS